MYRSGRLCSTLNTNVVTGLGMCEVCTEAVDCVALWTRTLSQVWTSVKYVPKQNTSPRDNMCRHLSTKCVGWFKTLPGCQKISSCLRWKVQKCENVHKTRRSHLCAANQLHGWLSGSRCWFVDYFFRKSPSRGTGCGLVGRNKRLLPVRRSWKQLVHEMWRKLGQNMSK